MKKTMYLEKSTIMNLINGEVKIYYRGKDDYVRTEPHYCEPWSRRRFAEKAVEDSIRFETEDRDAEKINDCTYITGRQDNPRIWFWLSRFEVMEFDVEVEEIKQ